MLGEGFGEPNGGRNFEEPLKSMTLDDWGDEEQINIYIYIYIYIDKN